MRRSRRSAAQTETLDELAVARDVDIGEVAEQTTTLTDEEEQATTRVVVVLVLLQVLGEVLDSLREERDLDLGGSSVTGVRRVLFDDRLLDISFKCHRWDPLSHSLRAARGRMPGLSLCAAVMTATSILYQSGWPRVAAWSGTRALRPRGGRERQWRRCARVTSP